MSLALLQGTADQLSAFAAALVDRAAPLVDDVEVMVIRRDVVSIAIENELLVPQLKLGRLQIGIRAIVGGKLAVAATTSLSVEDNLAALRAALPAARPVGIGDFGAGTWTRALDGVDAQIDAYSRDARLLNRLAIDIRDRTLAARKEFTHVDIASGRVGVSTRWLALATTKGSGVFCENSLSAGIEVNALHSEQELVRVWPADDSALRNVGWRAAAALPVARINPSDLGLGPAAAVTAILDPNLVEDLFRYPVHDKFLASSLVSRQTDLEPGAQIADARLRLVDTGAPRELFRPFDDELSAKTETLLIAGGLFTGFVSSRASAHQTGQAPTGNGMRTPILVEDTNEAPVRDRLGGLVLDPGTRDLAALIAATEVGILPKSVLGIHGADRARTAFSATVADGLAIRDGRVIGQLAPGMWNISGRVLPGNGEPGLLQDAEPSLERVFTGSAIFPYLRTTVTAG